MSFPSKPQSIVIVGGGTAGWLTAAVLCKAWPRAGGPTITLIESPDVGTIGVGESSIPPLRRLLVNLGMDESDWMPKCNATFKCASRFVGWSDLNASDQYHHPLFCWGEDQGDFLSSWLCERQAGRCDAPFDACFQATHLARLRKAPKQRLADAGTVQYAYHLDASLFANYLREWACCQGVTRIEDHVTGVKLSSEQHIGHLNTANHGEVSAEWFFDCTGFRGLLINQALAEPFVSYSNELFCDSAVAVMTTPNEPRQVEPVTTATALKAGWAWNVPLVHRNGTGYVYSSNELTPDQATQELLTHLHGVETLNEPRHIRMRVGRTRRTWVGNCISVGLSAGFIEPLESTAIFCIQFAVVHLLMLLRQLDSDSARDEYNRTIQGLFEGLRDFIVLHYHLTAREDTAFWKANKYHSAIPDSLQELLGVWRNGGDICPLLEKSSGSLLVGPVSWHCILAGMHCLPAAAAEMKTLIGSDSIAARVAQLREAAAGYPDHFQFLNELAASS